MTFAIYYGSQLIEAFFYYYLFPIIKTCFFTGLRWYHIKISMRWEDGDNNSCGIPSRVVQYEGTLFHSSISFLLNHFLLSFYLSVIECTYYPMMPEGFLNYMSIYSISVYYLCVTALDSTSNDSNGVWKIDDKDNSFLSQPFRIKYAKQDVCLCMMVSFTMPLERYEVSLFLSFFRRCLFYNVFLQL